MSQKVELINDDFIDFEGKIHHFTIAAVSVELPNCTDFKKGVSIGISICNPEDSYDSERGVQIAKDRAKKAKCVLYATDNSYINSKLVKALLEQEVKYIKNNPSRYIKGYDIAESKHRKKKARELIAQSFTNLERSILQELQKDPDYLTYLNNIFKKYLDE